MSNTDTAKSGSTAVLPVRLRDLPDDYVKLGVTADKVELWEDGRRNTNDPNHWEWWYFDAILDDGTTVVIQFLQKTFATLSEGIGHPSINFKITLPDGTRYEEQPSFTDADCQYSTDKCDVKFGDNSFVGDLDTYEINVSPVNGIAASLKLKSITTPFRPGAGYFSFGDDDTYYTWLCVVPRGEVSGTITVGGKTMTVKGFGYHDHQWGSASHFMLWNHWTWGRQSFDDYTMVIFDMVANSRYGFKRFPLAFIQDKDGKIIFSNTHDVEYEVLEDYTDEESGKIHPKAMRYRFDHDGKQIDYSLRMDQILESVYAYGKFPEHARQEFDKLGLRPSYTRYLGTGDLTIRDGSETIERSGKLVYEFMYPGSSYKDADQS